MGAGPGAGRLLDRRMGWRCGGSPPVGAHIGLSGLRAVPASAPLTRTCTQALGLRPPPHDARPPALTAPCPRSVRLSPTSHTTRPASAATSSPAALSAPPPGYPAARLRCAPPHGTQLHQRVLALLFCSVLSTTEQQILTVPQVAEELGPLRRSATGSTAGRCLRRRSAALSVYDASTSMLCSHARRPTAARWRHAAIFGRPRPSGCHTAVAERSVRRRCGMTRAPSRCRPSAPEPRNAAANDSRFRLSGARGLVAAGRLLRPPARLPLRAPRPRPQARRRYARHRACSGRSRRRSAA